MVLVVLLVAGTMGLSAYYEDKYPSEIVLEGSFGDISQFDFEFTDRDLKDEYDVVSAVKISFSDGRVCIGDNMAEDELEENNEIESISDRNDKIVNDNEGKVQVTDKTINIIAGRTYILSGEFNEYTVVVAIDDTSKIQLVLNNCSIKNEQGPALYIKSADKVFVTLADNSKNYFSDGSEYEYKDGDTTVDGAVFSRADLTFNGTGTLKVNGNYKQGIVSKDDIVIGGGVYDIVAVKKGLNGKDGVKINDCDRMDINVSETEEGDDFVVQITKDRFKELLEGK